MLQLKTSYYELLIYLNSWNQYIPSFYNHNIYHRDTCIYATSFIVFTKQFLPLYK